VVQRLLERHRLSGADVTLVSHQASSVLIDAWQAAIRPAQYLQTLEKFANMTVANVPFSLAYRFGEIDKDWLVLLAVGVEMHANAVLLRRGK
jgi:3-oxoacyl-[acyl-carrier-protein] synthase-3